MGAVNSSRLLKLVVAFFAVLGLAAVPALADDTQQPQDQQQQQQQAPDQQTPDQQGQDGTGGATGGAGTDEGGDEQGGTATQAGKPTQEEIDRFNRFCNMKDAEPSHSDKAFCDQYRKTHPTTSTTDNGKRPLPTTDPGHEGSNYHYEKPSYEQPSYHKASEPSKGSLPFTGLEIWQLGLIGIVLVGGGIGARRLLVS